MAQGNQKKVWDPEVSDEEVHQTHIACLMQASHFFRPKSSSSAVFQPKTSSLNNKRKNLFHLFLRHTQNPVLKWSTSKYHPDLF